MLGTAGDGVLVAFGMPVLRGPDLDGPTAPFDKCTDSGSLEEEWGGPPPRPEWPTHREVGPNRLVWDRRIYRSMGRRVARSRMVLNQWRSMLSRRESISL